MRIFVLDADAAIKLAKAAMLDHLVSFASCAMAKQAYDEAMRGKEKMYEDAFAIEKLAENGRIRLSAVEVEREEGLGLGECATLALFRKMKADAIISDDRRFLSLLEGQEIPFMTSGDSIVLLARKRKISIVAADEALEAIRYLIREEQYQFAKRMIGGK